MSRSKKGSEVSKNFDLWRDAIGPVRGEDVARPRRVKCRKCGRRVCVGSAKRWYVYANFDVGAQNGQASRGSGPTVRYVARIVGVFRRFLRRRSDGVRRLLGRTSDKRVKTISLGVVAREFVWAKTLVRL